MRFIYARVARTRELKGQKNIQAAYKRLTARVQIVAPARKHQNADLVYLIAMFSQSVSQSVTCTVCLYVLQLTQTCQLTQGSVAEPCNTPRVSLAQENALILTVLLSLVSRTLTAENTQAPKCLTQGTTHHLPPRQASRCASRPPAGTAHLSACTNDLV